MYVYDPKVTTYILGALDGTGMIGAASNGTQKTRNRQDLASKSAGLPSTLYPEWPKYDKHRVPMASALGIVIVVGVHTS